ncbi:helix-turn-helix domain-containing protein [Latilactobacillus curvatus]|uniref:helix-turn-helix domain-containing protein n=1 Tax=Latilactobacillus curvatus TaxID=28038 RepID=UPI000A268D8E|nr:helix-turn-helix domain-containing protein [Latilactobacillus curvatus]
MTKISKQIKLKAILEYHQGRFSKNQISRKYGINQTRFNLMCVAYEYFGPDFLLNPPKITSAFRIKIASWAIQNNASYSAVAAKFGYINVRQIQQWKEIYRTEGPNGLCLIQKGRKSTMTTKKKTNNKKVLSPTENRLKQLEAENLELRIKNKALKLLASMKQQTKKLPK